MTKPLDPNQDGKSHINIYSSGKTVLGRALSNFAHCRFTHDELGQFSGMEGLYYYLKTGKKHESFRRLAGYAAKKLGRSLPTVMMDKDEFHRLLKIGCRCIYRDNPKIHDLILDQVIENKGEVLPFTHYYTNGLTPVFPTGNDWVITEWTNIRNEAIVQAGGTIKDNDGKLFVTGITTSG